MRDGRLRAAGEAEPPSPEELERLAVDAARAAATLVRARRPDRATHVTGHTTKSSPTDIVTPTDRESERLLRDRLAAATPAAGFVGEEDGASGGAARVQWIVDPLDGTVNFWYGLPVVAVSVAAAVDGVMAAGAVVDIASGQTFSAARGGGSRLDGHPIAVSGCGELAQALVTTGFSYQASVRAEQGAIVGRLVPQVRDIRCFGSAALQLCWVGCGRTDAHFERGIKVWDYSAGALIADEAGATVELPCPENDGLVCASTPAVFEALRALVEQHAAMGEAAVPRP